MNIDYFMQTAIKEAKKAFKNEEVPVGGLIVDNESELVIAKNHNKINKSKNSMYHCEILLIIEACKKLNSKYLSNTTLFITLEPCIMCSAAISEVHISRVYFSAYHDRNFGIEKFCNLSKNKGNFLPDIYGGIKENESKKLMKDFFKKQRI